MTPYTRYHSLVDDTAELRCAYESRKRSASTITDYAKEDESADMRLTRRLATHWTKQRLLCRQDSAAASCTVISSASRFFCVRCRFVRKCLFECYTFFFKFFLCLSPVVRFIDELLSFKLENIVFVAQSFEQ